jgi:hypothetical protein
VAVSLTYFVKTKTWVLYKMLPVLAFSAVVVVVPVVVADVHLVAPGTVSTTFLVHRAILPGNSAKHTQVPLTASTLKTVDAVVVPNNKLTLGVL